jgi:lipoprotein-releasing system permease protein
VVSSTDPLASLSESVAEPMGVFSVQQDFDNLYAITNLEYVRTQTGLPVHYYSAAEIKLKEGADENEVKKSLMKILGKNYIVQTRYEQNTSLYGTMKSEKWIIYAVLTLILIIAAFNMIGALTMLVMEKKQDISILKSMGAAQWNIRRIFLTEGLMLGGIGAMIGLALAYLVCLLQIKLKLIKISGSSFVIDYFPVKLLISDFFLVCGTVMLIIMIASWLPTKKASEEAFSLK